jgi:hypothetical protein
METRTATILGCGIAGSWVAHHLVAHDYKRFVLFGASYDPSTLLRLGPFSEGHAELQTSALTLASHLLSLSPDLTIELHGNFNPDRDRGFVKGDVVGAMGGKAALPLCAGGAFIARSQGGRWITLALPSEPGNPIIISENPDDLTPQYLTGTPLCSREEISSSAAEAASRLVSAS